MSETWLKNHKELLEYVSLPGYATEFRHREIRKGGGVGVYIRDNVKYKRREDLENMKPELEHLWIEVPGRNKHSKLLLGVMYRSETILNPSAWLDHLGDLLGYINTSWNGFIVLTGDMNIDLLGDSSSMINRYVSFST